MKLRNLKFVINQNQFSLLKTGIIVTWLGITATSLALNLRQHEEKIIIIRETSSGNYVIPERSINTTSAKGSGSNWDPVVDAESLHKVNFIKRYLALVYNFDRNSIEDQLALGTDLMSEEFYQRSIVELSEIKKGVQANSANMTQSLEVLSITKVSSQVFDVEGRISTVKEGKNYSFDYLIQLKIKEASKTRTNPWGLEVSDVKETRK